MLLSMLPDEMGLRESLGRRLREASLCVNVEPPPDADAALILGNTAVSTESVSNWLKQGKHVLLTGYQCSSLESLEILCQSARHSGAQLMIANPERFRPSRQLIREQLASGKLGTVGLLRSQTCTRNRSDSSVGDHIFSGLLGHALDVALWLVGKSFQRVFATGSLRAELAGPITAHLSFSEGAMGLVSVASSLLNHSYSSLSVIGSAGAAYADSQQNLQLLLGTDAQAVLAGEGDGTHLGMVQEFVDSLNANRDLSPSVEEWRRILKIVQLVRRSLESRQAISTEEC
jgi:predicted dehydrogenase